MATRPTIFKWRRPEPALILCAVRWYLRYSLSLRDVEELLEERGLEADHYDGLAMGAALRPRVRATTAPASEADKQVVADR